MYQSYDLLAATIIAKIRNIKLKHTILVSFIFLFSLHPNEARENHNNNIIKTVTEKILGEVGFLFGFSGNIIDWICTSTYNHYTEHNLREAGWYHGKFFIYGGRKFEITKNVYLDVYYSFLKLIPFFIIDVNIYGGWRYLLTLYAFITISINIRIYKNFYLAIAPIHYILYKIMVSLVYMSHRQKWDQELEDEKRSRDQEIEDGKRRINSLKRKLTININ